jgi:hypothetical protein
MAGTVFLLAAQAKTQIGRPLLVHETLSVFMMLFFGLSCILVGILA